MRVLASALRTSFVWSRVSVIGIETAAGFILRVRERHRGRGSEQPGRRLTFDQPGSRPLVVLSTVSFAPAFGRRAVSGGRRRSLPPVRRPRIGRGSGSGAAPSRTRGLAPRSRSARSIRPGREERGDGLHEERLPPADGPFTAPATGRSSIRLCGPGSSSWPDRFSPSSRWLGSSPNLSRMRSSDASAEHDCQAVDERMPAATRSCSVHGVAAAAPPQKSSAR